MTSAPDFAAVPNAWQERFAFYQQYGQPGSTPAAKDAYRSLPFFAKMKLAFNVWAFLFGPFYFFVKGMWRKGLTILGAALVLASVLAIVGVPETLTRAVGFGFAGAVATLANWAYYLHVSEKSQGWNPFEGYGRKGAV